MYDGGVIVDGDEVAGNDRTTERPKGWWRSRNGLAVKGGRAGERAVVRVETASPLLLIARREGGGGARGVTAVKGAAGE